MRGVWKDIKSLDPRATAALLVTAVVLLLLEFKGQASAWRMQPWLRERYPFPKDLDWASQVAWALSAAVLLGLGPFLFAVLGMRMKPRDFGFRWRGFVRHLPLYMALYVLMVPLIWWASTRPSFLQTYPFPHLARENARAFWMWEAVYLLQFAALEMFFRGFLVFSLERRFGLHGIFVMVIPYAMIHLHKPMPEAFGAIGAGILLGYLALRTRSFYGGILLHFGVALTMDLLARGARGP